MKRKYFVSWGVDRSHMVECKSFDLKREAVAFASKLPKRYVQEVSSLDFPSKWSPGRNKRIL